MSFARGRELLDPSPEPPVRLLTRPSVPFNGPEVPTVQDGSLGAYVDAKSSATSEVLPTSPGKTRSQLPGASHLEDYPPPQAGGRAAPLHLAPNVGHDMSHVSLTETRHGMPRVCEMQMGSEMFHISDVEKFSTRNDDSVYPTHFDKTVIDERFDDSVATQRLLGNYGNAAYGYATDAQHQLVHTGARYEQEVQHM